MGLPDSQVSDFAGLQRNFDWLAGYLHECDGTPEGQVTAKVGAVCFRRDGSAGTTLYVKESGTGTPTGWIAK